MDAIVSFIVGIIQLAFFAAVILAIVAIWGYNTLRRLAEAVKESESNIGVAVRKKVSLVNQLLDVASTYMDRETLVMLKVSQDASAAGTERTYMQSGTVLSTIQGIASKFPDLKGSDQYSNLGNAISVSESEVQNARQRYNAAIKEYNSKRSALPHALYAGFLGFKPAKYLDLDNIEAPDAGVQKQIISDDGDRLNQLLGMAGTKVLDATKAAATQGKLIAERAAKQVQAEIASRAVSAAAEFHYLDLAKTPQGPVSRSELDALFFSGVITADTDVLDSNKKTWTKYSTLIDAAVQ
jgi:hypothetical protein